MKKSVYTVKGLNSDNCDKVLLKLRSIVPNAENIECLKDYGKLSFCAKLDKKERAIMEKKLSAELLLIGCELILPEGVQNFSLVGEKARKSRSIPLSTAISLIAVFVAVTVLLTFASCGLYGIGLGMGNSAQGGNGTTQSPTTIVIDDDDIPPYIQELIKLDEVFKMYSYEGINEAEMGASILKSYIAATGDKYAEYMTKEEYEAYISESNGDFVGIGISIINTTVEVSGYYYKALQVVSVFEGSPASESGVRVGDYIVYVGTGSDKILVDVLGHTAALNLLLGEEGTKAEFSVFRPDKSSDSGYTEIEFLITRKAIQTESVTYRISKTDKSVGIVNVTGFDLTTATQFKAAIKALQNAGCSRFVFDMRNNPGGALYSIQAVLSYFLNEGDLIVSTEYSDGNKEEYKVKAVYYGSQYEGYNVYKNEIGMYKDLDCIVLTNGNTASAAELFTATMRDYNIAKIVGETTYGKGCMQSIIDLSDFGMEGGLRVTTAMYFSKSHTVYHDKGIVPDYQLPLSDEAAEYNFFLLPEEKDNQMQKAIEELLK